MPKLKAGEQLRSQVCTTTVVVVRASAAEVVVECGGLPMLSAAEPNPKSRPLLSVNGTGTLLGKRYADDEAGIELLCVKGGDGSLSLAGSTLSVRQARSLPASD